MSGLEEKGRRSTWNILVVKVSGFAYEKENAMATVPYRLENQEDLDDQDAGYPDPLAVVDAPFRVS